MEHFELFLDGRWQPAADGRSAPSVDPAREEPWAEVAAAGPADVDAAVAAARRSYASGVWRDRPAAERAQVLADVAAAIFDRADELAQAEVRDGGGTMRKATLADVPAAGQTFLHFAELLGSLDEEEAFTETTPVNSRNVVRREPLGVCAAITPFNFPLVGAAWKIAPAIAAGNSVVIKPSPHTPVTTLLLAEICHKAGVPAGVVNVVAGPDAALGEAVVRHPGVDKIAFTGSTETGRRIMAAAAPTLKRLTLELGGKSPNILLDDANLDGAIAGALFGTFFHAGQVCESGTRLLVQRAIHDQVLERLVEGARALRLGDPLDPATMLGPLVSGEQRARTERYVAAGLEAGARCISGGRRPDAFARGYYYEPTIFAGVDNGMRIAREEIFGPVLSVIPFADDAEALAIANDSAYGLGAAVWSRDEARARRLAERIEAGTVWINDYHLLNVRFPFGGYKQSGFGRELGKWGLAEYQQLKHIHIGEPAGAAEKFYFGLLMD
jgi:aldehyde dehydrogenase (NAD+)